MNDRHGGYSYFGTFHALQKHTNIWQQDTSGAGTAPHLKSDAWLKMGGARNRKNFGISE
jgi:hypothetical protein